MIRPFLVLVLFLAFGVTACETNQSLNFSGQERVILTSTTFLADIIRNVAGDRFKVDTLIPLGLDPHAFEPTPQDVARIADADLLVINGSGFEEWLEETLENTGGNYQLIEASKGMDARLPGEEHHADDVPGQEGEASSEQPAHTHTGDPHFWLDPLSVINYVLNIRDNLIAFDPSGADIYTQNADAYIAQLKDLDAWVHSQFETIPPERRLLVTNHESFGYYANRYGLTIIGTVIPSVSSGSSPTAKELAALVEIIRNNGIKAIFLESGANPELAEQIARETNVKVISGLYSHSISEPSGPAPTYLDMIRYNTTLIVENLR
jgi:ABC-type Zn uptake system ZnuABC Zn-binding protein ZnuA